MAERHPGGRTCDQSSISMLALRTLIRLGRFLGR
jgi:hypothetical protein